MTLCLAFAPIFMLVNATELLSRAVRNRGGQQASDLLSLLVKRPLAAALFPHPPILSLTEETRRASRSIKERIIEPFVRNFEHGKQPAL